MTNRPFKTTVLATAILLALAPRAHAAGHATGGTPLEPTAARAVRQEFVDAALAIRDEAAAKAKAGLDALEANLEALQVRVEKRWETMDAAARNEARASLRALQRKRVEVAAWYGGVTNSSTTAWDHMKTRFSGACESLRTARQKAGQAYADDNSK